MVGSSSRFWPALRQAGLNDEAENLAVEILLDAAGRLSLTGPDGFVVTAFQRNGIGAAMSDAKDGSKDASADRNLDLFLDMMAAERGASANTLAAYRLDLQQVAAFLAQKGESERRLGQKFASLYGQAQ